MKKTDKINKLLSNASISEERDASKDLDALNELRGKMENVIGEAASLADDFREEDERVSKILDEVEDEVSRLSGSFGNAIQQFAINK